MFFWILFIVTNTLIIKSILEIKQTMLKIDIQRDERNRKVASFQAILNNEIQNLKQKISYLDLQVFQLIHTALDLGDKIELLEKIEKSQYPVLELILDHKTSLQGTEEEEEKLVKISEIDKLAIEAFNHLDKNFFQVFLERGQYYLLTLTQSTRTKETSSSNKNSITLELVKNNNEAEFFAIKIAEKKIFLFPNFFSPYYQQLHWLYEYEHLDIFRYSGVGSTVQIESPAEVEYLQNQWSLVRSGCCILVE